MNNINPYLRNNPYADDPTIIDHISQEDIDNFNHDDYEQHWAHEHPMRYRASSMDAIISNGTPPDEKRLPIFFITLIVIAIVCITLSL